MGHIYILYNELFGENVYKIGMTTNLKSRLTTYNTGFPYAQCKYVYTKEVDKLNLRNMEKKYTKKLI